MIIDTEFNSAAEIPALQCLDGARLADERGFGCVWKGESNSRDPLVLLSAVSGATRRIDVGTAVYHIFGRSPVTMAVQAATLNELSGGRFILGLGVANPTLAAWNGASYDRPIRRMKEYVDIVRAAYAGDRVDYAGECYTVGGFKMSFKAPDGPLRIWLAALGPQMSHLAGRISDGVLINMASPDMVREIVDNCSAGAASVHRDFSGFGVLAKVRVSINDDIALARAALKKVATFYTLAFGYQDLLRRMGLGTVVESVQAAYKTGGFDAARRQIPDEMLERVPMIAASSIDQVAERLRDYERAGATRCDVAYVVSTADTWGEIRHFVETVDLDLLSGTKAGGRKSTSN